MPVTLSHRLYFAAVGAFALWVGLWGYLFPLDIDRAIPWKVPPLHARFLGAMYLSGMVLMLGSLVARTLAEVRIAVPMAAVWTGMLLLVSLLHLDEFDFDRRPVWFWFFAYIVYPLAGAYLAWTSPPDPPPDNAVPSPAWTRGYFLIQGVASTALAIALFSVPSAMAAIWPWKIPTLLAQIYSGPFLSYGIGSLLLASRRTWLEMRLPALSMLVFALLVLTASLIHRGTFAPEGLSAALWFGGFAVAVAGLALVCAGAFRPRRSAQIVIPGGRR